MTTEGAIYPTPWEKVAPYAAEFCGSFLLTMTFVYNYSSGDCSEWTATSNGLMVAALMYALGHVSGGTFNPAVSVSLMFLGRYTPSVTGRLCLAQLSGAIAAGVIRALFFHGTASLGPLEGYTWRGVCAFEFIYSAMICFVYLNCAASLSNNPLKRPNRFVGLAVGMAYVAGGYAARQVSHPVMNTAIAVGLGVVENKGLHAHSLFYIFADGFGALLGAGFFKVVRPGEDFSGRQSALAGPRKHSEGPKVTAEFIGTFFIVLTKACNRLGESSDREGVGPEAWSVAAVIICMVYSLRNISGAYFNPAITLAAVVTGRNVCSKHAAAFYGIAQFFAAVAAGSVFAILNHGNTMSSRYGYAHSYFSTVGAEMIFSLFLTYVVLTCTVSKHELGRSGKDGASYSTDDDHDTTDVAGLAYGACHTAGGFAIGQISGAMLNPAIAFSFCGLDMLHGRFDGDMLSSVFYQVVGSLVGAGIFMVTHSPIYRKTREAHEQQAQEGTPKETDR